MVHRFAGRIVIEMHESMLCNQLAQQCMRLLEGLLYSMMHGRLFITWVYAYSKYPYRVAPICTY